mgnify:FL=1
MFTIRYHNQGFKVSTGDGSPVFARDVDELHLAIDHYFGRHRALFSGKCPLCLWVADHAEGGRK